MTTQENLKTLAHQLLAGAELPHEEVIKEDLHPEHFGDGEVVFKVGPMHVRFVRERGQDFVDVSPASAPGEYHPFGDVEVVMGLKTVDQVWSRPQPEPLPSILQRMRNHYSQLEDAFSSAKTRETVEKLKFTSRRREAAFAHHLRRLGADVRKQ